MKCFPVVVIGLAFLTIVSGIVEVTTDANNEKNEDTSEKVVPTEFNKGSVYLEDVVYALKNHEWSKEEELCLNQTLSLIRGLQNFKLWAVWYWDSIASEPEGLLFGNRYQLGNFDECLHPPWDSSHAVPRTQYCLAEIVLERTDNAPKKRFYTGVLPEESVLDFIEVRPVHSRPLNELTWGVCVPASCGPGSVERLLATMLARSHLGSAGMRARITLGENCQKQDEPVEYDGLFWAFVTVMATLTAITLICTLLNNKKDKLYPTTLKSDIIKAFCLKENAKNLLVMKKDGIEVLYGIRFLTICLIVMDHQIGMFNGGPISDGYRFDQDVRSISALFFLHDDLFVDTFFFLSGFLTTIGFNKFKKFPNPLLFILKRYIRLAVAYAVVIFYICAVFPYTGSGPLWPRAVAADTVQCRKNWWLSLLMLNNYIDSDNMCLVISWYIPCDFHFFCIAVMLYWLYKRLPKLACACAGLITVVAVILPGVINYLRRHPAVQLFTYEFVSNPRGSEQFHDTYIKSHTRAAAYIIGFYSGYLFLKYYRQDQKRIPKAWSTLGAIIGMIIMLVILVTGALFLWRSYDQLESAVYAALNRPVWTCGLAVFVLCCSLGHVPLVKSFLAWYPWVPLSRLSYGLYLVHSIFITRNVFTNRNSRDNNYPELINATGGMIVWGCLTALVIWLLAEAPANNLLSVILRPPRKPRSTTEIEDTFPNTHHRSVDISPSSSKGHLQTNLPTVVTISSKV